MSSTTLSTTSQDASPSGIVTRSRKRLLDEDVSEADPRDRKRSKVEPRQVRRSLRHAAKSRSPSPPHVERSGETSVFSPRDATQRGFHFFFFNN